MTPTSETPKKTTPAPANYRRGNKNAAKELKRSANLNVRCYAAELDRWHGAAEAAGERLGKWVRRRLNSEPQSK